MTFTEQNMKIHTDSSVHGHGHEITKINIGEEELNKLIEKSKKKELECTYCEKTFARIGDLKRHVNTVHLKLKPYKCFDCDKSYGLQQDLKHHFLSAHEKIKPFKCELCDTSFSKNSNLKTHVEAMHEKIKYVCDNCQHHIEEKIC